MITEQQQEQASLYALGALPAAERQQFELTLKGDPELNELVRSLQRASDALVFTTRKLLPPPSLREKVLAHIRSDAVQGTSRETGKAAVQEPGFHFHGANDPQGWKELPLRGAWVKLLSIEKGRDYAVLLGKLAPGVQYPPHKHFGPEDLYILTGDLHIGDRRLGPGDFHHSDAGTSHGVNYSVEGCILMAVLPADHELVQLALTGAS